MEKEMYSKDQQADWHRVRMPTVFLGAKKEKRKKEVTLKAKLLIHLSVSILTLSYGHKLWVVTGKKQGHGNKRPQLVSSARCPLGLILGKW